MKNGNVTSPAVDVQAVIYRGNSNVTSNFSLSVLNTSGNVNYDINNVNKKNC